MTPDTLPDTFQGTKAATNVLQSTIDVSSLSVSPPMGSITALNVTDTTGGVFNEQQTLVLANASGGTWRLAYNGQVTGRLAVTATAGQVDAALETLSGIGSGNLTTTGSAGNFTITFAGSKANTNMLQVFGDATAAYSGTTTRTITTTYNNAGEVASISDPAATINYTRDNLGRATTVSNTIAGLTPTVDLNQVFDSASNRSQLTSVIGGTNDFKNDYTYDALNRLTEIKQTGNGGNTVGNKHIVIGYNALGQRTSMDRYESLATTYYDATTNYTYDSANRLSTLNHVRSGTTLAGYSYTYDGLSRITSINSVLDGVSNFTYDTTSQLTVADHTSQTDENYGYDLNGNRNSSGFTTGQNNQTLAGGGFTYTYDDEGNRTSRTETSTGHVEEYIWDYRNRLVTVRDRNSSGGAIVMQVEYTYDPLNRMQRRTYDADGAGSGIATDQFWAYDEGINALFEFNGTTGSDLKHRYLWSDQVDELLVDSQLTNLTTAGNAIWGLADHLGTIRDLADYVAATDTTTVTNHRVYNAYGKLVSETNSAVDLLFGFTGKQLDDATGLQHNLFRWYDSNLGQWLSEDPMSFAAGDENVRRYVGNGATNATDPSGLRAPTNAEAVELLRLLELQIQMRFLASKNPGNKDFSDLATRIAQQHAAFAAQIAGELQQSSLASVGALGGGCLLGSQADSPAPGPADVIFLVVFIVGSVEIFASGTHISAISHEIRVSADVFSESVLQARRLSDQVGRVHDSLKPYFEHMRKIEGHGGPDGGDPKDYWRNGLRTQRKQFESHEIDGTKLKTASKRTN